MCLEGVNKLSLVMMNGTNEKQQKKIMGCKKMQEGDGGVRRKEKEVSSTR